MAKLSKTAEYVAQLHSLVEKKAADAKIKQSEAADKASTTIAANVQNIEGTKEPVIDKDKTTAPSLDKDQGPEQKPSTENAVVGKAASDKGEEILKEIKEVVKQSEAQDKASPKIDANVQNIQSVDEPKIDKDKTTAPSLNNDQGPKQEAQSADAPVGKSASAEELAVKVASYQLGKELVGHLVKLSGMQKESSVEKTAGRRDADKIIDAVTAYNEKLAKQNNQKKAGDDGLEKEAQYEALGAACFHELNNQVKTAALAEECEFLKAKLAELQGASDFEKIASEKQAKQIEAREFEKQAAEQKAALVREITASVVEALKQATV